MADRDLTNVASRTIALIQQIVRREAAPCTGGVVETIAGSSLPGLEHHPPGGGRRGFVTPVSKVGGAMPQGGGGDLHLHNHVHLDGEFKGNDHIQKSAVQAAQAVLTHPSIVKFMQGAIA